jgi:hypothetical protein
MLCIFASRFVTGLAAVMELVDMLDLGSSAARRGGSTPFSRTIKNRKTLKYKFLRFLFSVSSQRFPNHLSFEKKLC